MFRKGPPEVWEVDVLDLGGAVEVGFHAGFGLLKSILLVMLINGCENSRSLFIWS